MIMRGTVLILCISGVLLVPGIVLAKTNEDTAALVAVQTLLDGWREADAAKLESVLHKDFREVTLHLQDGVWNSAVVDRATLIETMSKIQAGSWDDQLIDPKVLTSGPIAVVWSQYRFTIHYTENGVAQAPSHCGIETFQLYKVGSEWKIINFADTHSDTCP